MNVIVQPQASGPGFLVRAVWFVFIGWWLSAIATVLAYALCITIIGLPFGFALVQPAACRADAAAEVGDVRDRRA
jgi:uncharacterized membrane protein YccF (DUF307 family)